MAFNKIEKIYTTAMIIFIIITTIVNIYFIKKQIREKEIKHYIEMNRNEYK